MLKVRGSTFVGSVGGVLSDQFGFHDTSTWKWPQGRWCAVRCQQAASVSPEKETRTAPMRRRRGGWPSTEGEPVAAGCRIQMVASDILRSAMIPTEGRCCFGMVTVCLWVDVSFCGSSSSLCTKMPSESLNIALKQRRPLAAWTPWCPLLCRQLWRKEVMVKLKGLTIGVTCFLS